MYLYCEVVETFVGFVVGVHAVEVNENLPDSSMSVNDKI